MKISKWLRLTEQKLAQAGVGTARLDAVVLLEDALNTNRTQILAHPELELTAAQERILSRQIARRVRHEPLAYIRGHTEFYGREFIITKAVLEPRPESEAMIDMVIELSKALPHPRRTMRIADVGTGSGALGITVALELAAPVDLLEIDEAAIQVAKKNVIEFATKNKVIRSDLLSAVAADYDILLCNLPYVPDDFHINPAAMNEPRIAIFGGPDGLDIYRRLFTQLHDSAKPATYVLAESLPPQHTKLAQIAKTANYRLAKTNDFIQLFKLA
jgi:release factor glutamine methyltransferase